MRGLRAFGRGCGAAGTVLVALLAAPPPPTASAAAARTSIAAAPQAAAAAAPPRSAPPPRPAAATPAPAEAATLPPAVLQALQRARVPADALAVLVQEAGGGRTLLAHNEQLPLNPASLMKLPTTLAALEQLGPAWTWSTPVWLVGPVADGVLDGSLVLRGSGDPQLVVERVWLLLRRVMALGVREIRGDIVLDRSAFAPAAASPADFDGDPTRPYNVQPDALLLNYRSVSYRFVPDAAAGVARVLAEPPLADTRVTRSVPLAAGACADWRGALKADFHDAANVRFAGAYPAACGEQAWPVADADPASYDARLLRALWAQLGGRLQGRVVDGAAPAAVAPSFELRSAPLADVVRDLNKYSNNLMAQQLLLTLVRERDPALPASAEAGRALLRDWLAARVGPLPAGTVVDNGSGLSRANRLAAAQLAQLLQQAWSGPTMPELISSLPLAGLDGTLRRSRTAVGRAHLKTGSLDGVAGIAGYVLADSGRRYVLVAIVNHPNAAAARPALEALLQWTLHDTAVR